MKPLGTLGLVLLTANLSAATFTVTNTGDSGAGSLRQAILDANSIAGADTIAFDIPGAGVHTITPATPLPFVSEAVVIDGYTQPGSSENTDPVATNAVLLIELDGSVAGGTGLRFNFGSSSGTIQGLVVNRWDLAISNEGFLSTVTVRGNFIGTDPTGSSARANVIGVTNGPNTLVVGGTAPGDRNLVSGNDGPAGIQATAAGVTVQGNLIGTDASGTVAIPNNVGVAAGIVGVTGATIGGSATGAWNVISGNNVALQLTQSAGNVIHGNRIGTTADGTGSLGNSQGIVLQLGGNNNIIGGTGPGEANVIAYNVAFGIQAGDAGIQNVIRGNSIHSNGGLGIDLTFAGPNSNDPLDADGGSNLQQNAPILQSIEHLGPQGGGSTRIVGKLHSTPSTTFTLDFYSNPACSNFPRELPEGETYLGEADVTTDVNGNAEIDVTLPVPTEIGARIAATATDPNGNTSEFSPRILFSLSPSSGPAAGGSALNAFGTDFSNPTTVTIGGVSGNPVFVSATQLGVTAPAFDPGTAHEVVATTTDGTTGTLIKGWVANFLDVPAGHQFIDFVTMLISNGITSGIGGGNYAPDQATLRQQMAVFLLKGKYGLCYTPPPCESDFPDVQCPSTFADWIEALADEGITGGCGGGGYCPVNPVLRQQMAVFLLKAKHGSTYTPPSCTGAFNDVACPSTFADWIEQLAAEEITGGCGGGSYCPLNNVTRGQMAVFITKTFGLQ